MPKLPAWNREELLRLADQIIIDGREVLAAAERSFARQAAYTEKLILLDGGTLTLTFTALAAIGAKFSVGNCMADSGELFWAWSLLIGAIISCALALKLTLVSASNSIVAQHSKLAIIRQKGISQMLKLLGSGHLTAEKADEFIATLEQHIKKASPQLGMSITLVYFAEALTVTAFILLLLFMKANMRVFFGG
jgi:hypothetical protein